ncbi:MAG: tRNA uridine(34) 5-carboxymethylaminomethyl modification radical SAM/GNAT enzyme Elp3 [Candidatus Thermoplasmatota archaeon]|jgi:elongator complex protein 3|nr:tRNA uridine(34) 5-carboxymethylaminomethyl modification radical SAM/GNAT enzyme Elp3 [Candidatus Thermoplasmatota archaeon]
MATQLEEYIRNSMVNVNTKEDLEKMRLTVSKKFRLAKVLSNTDILIMLGNNEKERYSELLARKPTRTLSGVSVIAVMTSPFSCPHGRCTYCPGGVDFSSPQSYTGFEPAAMRGKQNNYNSYLQTKNRLEQLKRIGHPTDKIDLIVMGGTFTAREERYQREFIKGSLDAMNGFVSDSLSTSILENEYAENRCIGLTVETRPDWFFEREMDLALEYGATKVELGVQTVFNDIHRQTKRAHRIYDVIRSTRYAKDSAFKILYHLMPGIGGVDREGDIKSLTRLFDDDRLRPDMLKIYPSLVVEGTQYYESFRRGEYRSYESEEAVEVVSEYFRHIPNYVRIHRIQRDIPVYKIVQGVKRSDLHDLALNRALEKGYEIKEIRYREIGHTSKAVGKVEMRITNYFASGGLEKFLEFVDERDKIIAFLRLRAPGENVERPELIGKTLIREIKTFGKEARIDEKGEYQHRGYGRRLLNEAEEITRELGYDGIAVISGIGVREYFRKNGYERMGPYMSKRTELI